MKKKFLLLLFAFISFCNAQNSQELTKPTGSYLGQEPPGDEPEIFAPGFISKHGRYEFCGSFSPDGKEFYYSVSQKDWSNNRILVTKIINEEWSEPSVVRFSGFDVDWSVFLSNDGKKLFFSSGRPIQSWNLDMWMSERIDNNWSEPVKMKINTSRSDFPGTTTEGGTLYFSSRFEKKGSVGILRSRLINNDYVASEKLPFPINTDNEMDGSPFISPDESFLLFSSQREGSAGDDIFICFRNKDDSWTDAYNLGKKINTDRNESLPILSPDGKYLFFTRGDGPNVQNREIDIYWVSSSVIDSIRQSLSLENK